MVDVIQTCLPGAAKIPLAPDRWTSPNKLASKAIVAYSISNSWQKEELVLALPEIWGHHTGGNLAGIINDMLTRYVIHDRIQTFTTGNASNNRTLIQALNNGWSLLSVEWRQLENHIASRAHVVQLILATFMSSIKVMSRDGHMPSGFKAGYIQKVMRLDNGFQKTLAKVKCLTSHALVPILQMHTHKCIRTNSCAQQYMYIFIASN